MIRICRNYYRRNLTELANIDEFDHTYRSSDAISWYMKETFLYKQVNDEKKSNKNNNKKKWKFFRFINKTLQTQDVDLLYQFRFYIIDQDEMTDYQSSIGNLISISGYLLTSSERSVAHDFATKSAKSEGVVRALFEYLWI
ncbi:unnamed protein product [Rotaria sp. Silwood1]|nr:unnamed protein product [Rotaria sp. Silwood1]